MAPPKKRRLALLANLHQANNEKRQLQAQKPQQDEMEAAEDLDNQSLVPDWSGEEEE